jgi:hypothetical protein
MKKYKKEEWGMKTVNFLPTHAQHEKSESKKYERMEDSVKKKFGHTIFVAKHIANQKNKGPESFTREQFEEKGKELEKTNKSTGLWYPHRA